MGAPWVSLVSFWYFWFVRVHPWRRLVRSGATASFERPRGRWVRSGSSGSFGCAPGVAWSVQFRLVRLDALWGSLGSFCFVCLRHVCRCVSLGSSRSCGCALAVAGFV